MLPAPLTGRLKLLAFFSRKLDMSEAGKQMLQLSTTLRNFLDEFQLFEGRAQNVGLGIPFIPQDADGLGVVAGGLTGGLAGVNKRNYVYYVCGDRWQLRHPEYGFVGHKRWGCQKLVGFISSASLGLEVMCSRGLWGRNP